VLSAEDFELLLPWYLNGSLTERERILVADYLKAHPEEDARVQWNASVRAGIKEQADALPEDLGLARILAAVNRDQSGARSARRAGNERRILANLAAWVASFGGSRARLRTVNEATSADWLGRGGGADLGRPGIKPWVAAVASAAVVSATVVILMVNRIEPARAPATVVADSRMPSRAPADEPELLNARGSHKERSEGSAVAQQQGAPWRAPHPASRHPEPKASPSQLASPAQEPVQVAQSRVAEPPITAAPSGTTASSSGETQAAGSSAAPPASGVQGEQVALGAPDKLPAVADRGGQPEHPPAEAPDAAGGAPQVPKALSSDSAGHPAQSVQSPLTGPPRVAISGKTDTSCPSTSKQREDALRAANPDEPIRTPAAWLEYIKDLLKAGCRDAADKEWVEFHKKYPNEKAPPELAAPR